jgi:hypothetical protein
MATSGERQMDEDDSRHEHPLQQQWHGWGSPVGLGVGLVCSRRDAPGA